MSGETWVGGVDTTRRFGATINIYHIYIIYHNICMSFWTLFVRISKKQADGLGSQPYMKDTQKHKTAKKSEKSSNKFAGL